MISITKTVKQDRKRTLIVRDGVDYAGKVVWRTDEGNSYAVFSLEENAVHELDALIPSVIQEMIIADHPTRIYVGEADAAIKVVLLRNGFQENGELLYMNIEPWRYEVEDRVFDKHGYIINQGKMDRLPYGAFSTKSRGCGWIAAYNLLKYLGRPMPMQKIAHELELRSFSGNFLGTNMLVLYRWLKSQGLPVRLVQISRKQCVEAMKQAECGILLYLHRRGGHYTCFRNNHDGTLHFWNAVYGRRNMDMEAGAFMEQHSFYPIAWLIWIPQDPYPVL